MAKKEPLKVSKWRSLFLESVAADPTLTYKLCTFKPPERIMYIWNLTIQWLFDFFWEGIEIIEELIDTDEANRWIGLTLTHKLYYYKVLGLDCWRIIKCEITVKSLQKMVGITTWTWLTLLVYRPTKNIVLPALFTLRPWIREKWKEVDPRSSSVRTRTHNKGLSFPRSLERLPWETAPMVC